MIEFYRDTKQKEGSSDKTIDQLKVELEQAKGELDEFKIQSALAQAEAFEKQEQDKITVMAAIAEMFEMGVGQ